MDIKVDVSVDGDDGIQQMIDNAKQLDGKAVEVGLFGGFAAQKAMWQEYGTSRGIPPRPFLRNTLYSKGPTWATFIAPFLQNLLEGGGAEAVINALGPKMMTDIRATIDEGHFAPLAPSTIRHKGSSKPLIDTGDMYGSVDWREA